MASTTQDSLYEMFLAIAGTTQPVPDTAIDTHEELANSVTDAAKAIESVGSTWQRITPVVEQGTGSIVPGLTAVPTSGLLPIPESITLSAADTSGTNGSTLESITSTVLQSVFGTIPLAGAVADATGHGSSGTSGGGGIGGTLETIATTVLQSGLGLVPLIGGLLGLFGGGGSSTQPPLEKYSLPSTIAFSGAETEYGMSMADYNQMGMPRAYGGADLVATSSRGAADGQTVQSPPTQTPQITVNVQAMDARSFLDRSSDIAAAVRDAMLSLNPINDVVNDL